MSEKNWKNNRQISSLSALKNGLSPAKWISTILLENKLDIINVYGCYVA